jgi:hypothetical protein
VTRSVEQGRIAGLFSVLGICTGTLFHLDWQRELSPRESDEITPARACSTLVSLHPDHDSAYGH